MALFNKQSAFLRGDIKIYFIYFAILYKDRRSSQFCGFLKCPIGVLLDGSVTLCRRLVNTEREHSEHTEFILTT